MDWDTSYEIFDLIQDTAVEVAAGPEEGRLVTLQGLRSVALDLEINIREDIGWDTEEAATVSRRSTEARSFVDGIVQMDAKLLLK